MKKFACIFSVIVIAITAFLYVNYTENGTVDIYNDNGTVTLEDGTIIDPVDGSVLWDGE